MKDKDAEWLTGKVYELVLDHQLSREARWYNQDILRRLRRIARRLEKASAPAKMSDRDEMCLELGRIVRKFGHCAMKRTEPGSQAEKTGGKWVVYWGETRWETQTAGYGPTRQAAFGAALSSKRSQRGG